MQVIEAHNPEAWNAFLASQRFRPFLQSWEMGEVYREIGQEPVRLEVLENGQVVGICFGHIVPARRGRHVSIPYGPIVSNQRTAISGQQILQTLIIELARIAKNARCSFIRLSPFWPVSANPSLHSSFSILHSPLHLLAEHLWYLPLREPDPWGGIGGGGSPRTPEEIFTSMRATTRNLIRRAEKEGVTVTVSDDPLRDLQLFLALHEETRRRHHFTPYTDAFFRAQVKNFSHNQCSLYLAHYKNEVIAASIHMHFAGETSYHHGASAQKYKNIPASYLLQWRAIQDAIARGDHIYNFWGIAPSQNDEKPTRPIDDVAGDGRDFFCRKSSVRIHQEFPYRPAKKIPADPQHPFAGVTLFKTGFGGHLLDLVHCMDLPLSPTYYLTRTFEMLRKWRRGF